MKVGELIEALVQVDPEFEVLTAVDEEGNGFHKGVDFDIEMYVEYGHEIEIHTPDDYKQGGYDGVYNPNCIVIWP